MPTVKLWFDGACNLKTKRGAIGFHMEYNQDGKPSKSKMEYTRCGTIDGECTNNIAEYTALVEGLTECSKRGFTEVEVFGDSQLVICQMRGEYKVKNAKLKPFHADATILANSFEKITFTWIPREENTIADGLSHQTDAEAEACVVEVSDGPGETAYRSMWNTLKDEFTAISNQYVLARINEIEESVKRKKDGKNV